jgi:hypothetical protein
VWVASRLGSGRLSAIPAAALCSLLLPGSALAAALGIHRLSPGRVRFLRSYSVGTGSALLPGSRLSLGLRSWRGCLWALWQGHCNPGWDGSQADLRRSLPRVHPPALGQARGRWVL